MGSEWRTVRLGDLAEIYDGPHATPHTVDEGPMFLGIVCLDGGRLDLAKAEHLTETDFTRWTRRVTPRPGDVVFSYETRIGEAARIPPGFKGCLGRRMGLLRPKPDVDPSFLLYAYLAPDFQETLRSRTIHGSTVDRIPLVQLGDFPMRVPPLAEQRVIGSVLAALDDKIDLNRRMSQTLESIARALFKSWFVDFDPVRVGAFGEIAEVARHPQDPALSPEALFDHYSLPAFDADQRPVVESGAAIKSLKLRIPADAILVSKLNPRIDRVWLVDTDRSRLSVASTEFLVLKPRLPYGRAYLYCLARSEGFRRDIQALATGTSNSHQRAQQDGVLGIQVPAGPAKLAQEFERTVKPILDRRTGATRQSLELAALRDSLLPRLVSGSKTA